MMLVLNQYSVLTLTAGGLPGMLLALPQDVPQFVELIVLLVMDKEVDGTITMVPVPVKETAITVSAT